MNRFTKVALMVVLTTTAIYGVLAFIEEYAKSYIRENVKEEVVCECQRGCSVCTVPAGECLAVNGEETQPDFGVLEGWMKIAAYLTGRDEETEELHLAGVIEIPSARIEEPVWLENTDIAMRYGVIVMSGFAGIEEDGNCVIVGHRNTVTHTIFDKLTEVKDDDMVMITTPDGIRHKYRVNGTYYCSPYELDNYIGTSPDHPKTVTLVTCARERGNSWRFIVTMVPE